jgi:Helix-turn-helix domain
MQEEQKEQPKYTTIIHQIRLDLELSCNEYCVADIIYHLSNNPTAKVQGWCYASKDHIADFMGLHRTAVYKIINKLIDLDLVIKDDDTKWLKTTEKWYKTVVIERIKNSSSKSLRTVEKSDYTPSQKATPSSSKSLHNIYIDNNNDIKEIEPTPKEQAEDFFSNPEKQEQLIEAMVSKGLDSPLVKKELRKFIDYWCELTRDGRKKRWELEKTFQVKQRLVTWFNKINEFHSKREAPRVVKI